MEHPQVYEIMDRIEDLKFKPKEATLLVQLPNEYFTRKFIAYMKYRTSHRHLICIWHFNPTKGTKIHWIKKIWHLGQVRQDHNPGRRHRRARPQPREQRVHCRGRDQQLWKDQAPLQNPSHFTGSRWVAFFFIRGTSKKLVVLGTTTRQVWYNLSFFNGGFFCLETPVVEK